MLAFAIWNGQILMFNSISVQKRSKVCNYLRFPSFCFLELKLLNFICDSYLGNITFLSFGIFFIDLEGVCMRPKMIFRFVMKRNPVYIGSFWRRDKIELIFVWIFWPTIFVFMKYLHTLMSPFRWFQFRVVFT